MLCRADPLKSFFVPSVAVAVIAIASVHAIGQCWSEITLGSACGLNDCVPAKAKFCAMEEIITDETVTTTVSPGTRANKASVCFLCRKTYVTVDEDFACIVQVSCQSTVQGSIVSGLQCSGGGGGDQ